MKAKTAYRRARWPGACAILLACNSAAGPGEDLGPPADLQPPAAPLGGEPFAPVPPRSYVAKVKAVLLGLPPTDAEIAAVQADPAALPGLIDQWMAQPGFQRKMLDFFRNAFQQGQLTADSFNEQLGGQRFQASAPVLQRLLFNLQDSFPRTVWQLAVVEGRPLHEAFTTDRFLLTPPLAAYYAFLDSYHVSDQGQVTDRVARPGFRFSLQRGAPPIPLEQTLDGRSANFMKWQSPIAPPPSASAACQADPRTYSGTSTPLLFFLFGALRGLGECQQTFTGPAQFADEEFDAWRPVRVRTPRSGEAPTAFYDLPALRSGAELVLRVPRVGFFSTPAFFANWPTNPSNQARVLMNQTLIVALGRSFDDNNVVVPVSEQGLDAPHINPQSVCYGCHKSLDPMRQTLRQAYTLGYRDQDDPAQQRTAGSFAFDGVSRPLSGVADLGAALAAHPRFAGAWVQKLCYFANSTGCAADDPELLQVAARWQASNYNVKVLVRELLSSPLVTGSRVTQTAQVQGVRVGIARREQLCASLSERVGLPDLCGAYALTATPAQRRAQALAFSVPADGYSRGAEAPSLATDPNLFFRSGVEGLCRLAADQAVDAAGGRYSSERAAAALDDLVQTVMGLPGADSRAAGARQILAEHHQAALREGVGATEALRSAFTLACLAPSSVGIGL